MSFDTSTRNRLQQFVGEARKLLTEEATRQLQQDYGLDPVSGSVTPVESLGHLDDRRLETTRILREIFEHYLPTSVGKDEEERRKATLERIAREQAFTMLNRLVALRMMEARGLLLQSVGAVYQSTAFQLYQRVAGTALGETGDAYRVFLLSVCDLYAADLPVLFDRHYPNGRLLPREPTLLAVLGLINTVDIESIWSEDETIGWIYQYFNSKDERKKMREESQAPRNSRELAVRNQFFTPRYVVEFLVDNTLGRLWFDWTGGRTALHQRCHYLLVADERSEPSRRLRDPRTIKLLDPACGSMHFGLYAFDLFLEIYREAWAWEGEHGTGSLDSETGGSPDLKPLHNSYLDEAAFLRDVPRLIIENNIWGVDIDQRAAQIASLALWLRAHRAWRDAGMRAEARPQVGRGHVMAAVAPPMEVELRRSFMVALNPKDAELFEKTLLLLNGLPELGVLLEIEKELPRLVREVFHEVAATRSSNTGGLFEGADEKHWREAEGRLAEALAAFAQTARATYQGRLFAEDALEGFRIVDIARETFDVVLMNPPFGALSVGTKERLAKAYPASKNDLLAIFVERGLGMLRREGRIGAITSRACFFLTTFQKWREEVVLGLARPQAMVDLGHGVMDDAMVEAAAYVLEKPA